MQRELEEAGEPSDYDEADPSEGEGKEGSWMQCSSKESSERPSVAPQAKVFHQSPASPRNGLA